MFISLIKSIFYVRIIKNNKAIISIDTLLSKTLFSKKEGSTQELIYVRFLLIIATSTVLSKWESVFTFQKKWLYCIYEYNIVWNLYCFFILNNKGYTRILSLIILRWSGCFSFLFLCCYDLGFLLVCLVDIRLFQQPFFVTSQVPRKLWCFDLTQFFSSSNFLYFLRNSTAIMSQVSKIELWPEIHVLSTPNFIDKFSLLQENSL